MVTIVNYAIKKNSRGDYFVVLNLESDVVMERSEKTGNWFANTFRSNIIASFDEHTAKAMIGKQLPGSIVKVPCEPYSYKIKGTNKVKELTHRFQYVENGVDISTSNASGESDGMPF